MQDEAYLCLQSPTPASSAPPARPSLVSRTQVRGFGFQQVINNVLVS